MQTTQTFQVYNKIYKVYDSDLKYPLGEGAFATVFKVYNKTDDSNNLKMVMKRILKSKQPADLLKEEINTMDTLRKVDAHHVLFSLDHFEEDRFMYLILPYCNAGDLEKYMDSNVIISETQAKNFISQIVDGVYYLHSNGIIHRDLKLANVLLNKVGDDDLECFVADFGFSKKKDLLSTMCGTPVTMSPEVFHLKDGEKYSHKADIYSLGSMLYRMVAGRYPYQDLQSLNNVGKTPLRVPKSLNLSDSCLSFLECCLQLKADDRPSISELKQHPFLKESVPYYLKKGLIFEDGFIELFHTKKIISESVDNKIKQMSMYKGDVLLEHALKLVQQ
jgi:serine/threonine protein kinase